MLEIIVYTPAEGKKRYEVAKDSLMIGKAPGNDIQINSDGVSRYHARLTRDNGKLIIEDLGSTNGTFVNAKKVERHAIGLEDQVTIGNALLSFHQEHDESIESPQPASSPQEEAPPIAEALPPQLDPADRAAVSDDFYWKSLSSFLGPVWKYITDDTVSEIMINGPTEIYIERKGSLERIPEGFNEDQLHAAILNIAQYVGRRVSEQEPYLDARLPDGSRVAVLMPPCARKGTSVAIRKFSKEKLTLDRLRQFGSITKEMEKFLHAAVVLKKNIIVSGGTSSGKTSLLNVISSLIPENERIITIEDAAELQLTQDHVVPMETKPPDKKGRGQITIRDLVRVSLRMRPDRVVVGEIRGGEALDLLQAMNTGHSGSMATVHASSPRQALSRLETLSLFSGIEIPMRALRDQVASAVELVIQAARLPDHSRKVTHISEIGALREDGTYEVNDIFTFVRTGLGNGGKIEGEHRWTGYIPSFVEEMELGGLTEALALFSAK